MRTGSFSFIGGLTGLVLGLFVLPAISPQPLHELHGAQNSFAALDLDEPAEAGLEAARISDIVTLRLNEDLEAVRFFRPGYTFWQHIFTIPDGAIAFGSAEDGRLLATFPARGDWSRGARWSDGSLAPLVERRRLPAGLTQRREEVAELFQAQVGPVIHNATRGNFLLPNARRYGGFLEEWGRIYERFAVPAEIGLAQAILESGLNGRIRSEARALGFCQWLPRNWERMKRLSPHEIEGYNQTTQAPYCAAYLTVLATKYGSFIPALSEHHAGGTNVGRTVINGQRLGGSDIRDRYFLGSAFARDVREISLSTYREVVRTYGPRSFLYSEMVFGNAYTVRRLMEEVPQERIHAMRTTRSIPLTEITRRTGLSQDEIRRFNPALVRQVPPRATLYLPQHHEEFGADVSFWHRPPDAGFGALLEEFLRLDASVDEWEDPAFVPVLRDYQTRFSGTGTEEGTVMATVLAYMIGDIRTSGRNDILTEFRTSEQIERLFHQGVLEREALGLTAVNRR